MERISIIFTKNLNKLKKLSVNETHPNYSLREQPLLPLRPPLPLLVVILTFPKSRRMNNLSQNK